MTLGTESLGAGREANERFALGACDDVLVIIWFKTPTIEDFGLVESATTDLVHKNPKGIGLLIVIVEGNDKPPPPEVRRRNAELVARYQKEIWGMARVIEGSGLKSSMIRFALSTIDLLSSNSTIPEKTLDTVPAALTWLASLNKQLQIRSLQGEIGRLRPRQPTARRAGSERPPPRPRVGT